jgi:beta-alanine degradation protein BauB
MEADMQRSATALVEPPADWPDWLRRDFSEHQVNGCVGNRLVSETDRVRVWSLRLPPGGRLPFHRHVLNYFWTAITPGRARSHYQDGRVMEPVHQAGDTKHLHFGEGEFMIHDLENIGDTDLVFTTVEFLDSPNAPLPVPASARA